MQKNKRKHPSRLALNLLFSLMCFSLWKISLTSKDISETGLLISEKIYESDDCNTTQYCFIITLVNSINCNITIPYAYVINCVDFVRHVLVMQNHPNMRATKHAHYATSFAKFSPPRHRRKTPLGFSRVQAVSSRFAR